MKDILEDWQPASAPRVIILVWFHVKYLFYWTISKQNYSLDMFVHHCQFSSKSVKYFERITIQLHRQTN